MESCKRKTTGTQVEMFSIYLMALLHRLPRPRGSTYHDSVCLLYVRYVTQGYGRCAIVFDGYKDEPSTRDATHLRRKGASVTVNFTGGMIVQ